MSIRQEHAVDISTLEHLERIPMSREEFDSLPEAVGAEDIYRKSDDYRVAGVEQYWIVDRDLAHVHRSRDL